jgi:hypothetical protein
MRQELTEGVTVLQASMKPQLSKIVGYGEGILDHFRQNMSGHQVVTPELRGQLQGAITSLPAPGFSAQFMKLPVDQTIQRLISIEAGIHYHTPPPAGVEPFVVIARNSPILISAPHGTRTFRNNTVEVWHEEDEYTAGMALLLSEECGTSVIASVWRSDVCDPNFHAENQCLYKQSLERVVQSQGVRWVLDLHGAAKNSKPLGTSSVDLGTREAKHSIDIQHRDKLVELIESAFGKGEVSLNGFPASTAGTITAFCQDHLNVQAIQIEMKPSVRVPLRRGDASSYAKEGPFSAPPESVAKMLGTLDAFISYLNRLGDSH